LPFLSLQNISKRYGAGAAEAAAVAGLSLAVEKREIFGLRQDDDLAHHRRA